MLTLESLPEEIHLLILGYLPGRALSALCLTCRHFDDLLRDDRLWRNAVLQPSHQRSIFADYRGTLFDTYISAPPPDPHKKAGAGGSPKRTYREMDDEDNDDDDDNDDDTTTTRYTSWRELYRHVFAEHGWVIGTWQGNDEWTGQLLEVDYNPESGFIECYRLQPFAHYTFPTRFSRDRSVVWRDFHPDLRARGEVLFRAGRGSDKHRRPGDDILHRLVGFDDNKIGAHLDEAANDGSFYSRGDEDDDDDQEGSSSARTPAIWPTRNMPCPERIIVSKLDQQTHKKQWEDWSEHLFTLSRPVFNPMSLITPSYLPIPLPTHTTLFSRLPAIDTTHLPAGFEGWHGLFMGDYSAHGPELLYLDYPTPTSIRAVKVTGDPNVPRGEVSWKVDDLTRVKRVCEEEEWAGARAFDGVGHISPHGFSDPSWIEAEVIFYVWPGQSGATSPSSSSAQATSTTTRVPERGGAPSTTSYRPAHHHNRHPFDGTDPLRTPALSRSESTGERCDVRSSNQPPTDDDPTRFGVAIWWKDMKHISQFHKVVHITPPRRQSIDHQS